MMQHNAPHAESTMESMNSNLRLLGLCWLWAGICLVGSWFIVNFDMKLLLAQEEQSATLHHMTATNNHMDNEDVQKLKALLGCYSVSGDCLDKAQQFAEQQARDQKVLNQVQAKAWQRLNDASCLYNKTRLKPINLLSSLQSEYCPKKNWMHSFPNLNVVGFAKAGTSKLYSILKAHADIQPTGPHKEFCMLLKRHATWPALQQVTLVTQQNQKLLFKFHEQLAAQKSTAMLPSKLTINGCLFYPKLFLHYQYVKPIHSKFIILF